MPDENPLANEDLKSKDGDQNFENQSSQEVEEEEVRASESAFVDSSEIPKQEVKKFSEQIYNENSDLDEKIANIEYNQSVESKTIKNLEEKLNKTNKNLKKLEKNYKKLLKDINNDTPEKTKTGFRNKYLYTFIGGVGTLGIVGSFIVAAIVASSDNSKPLPPVFSGLTEKQKEFIDKLIDIWMSLDEKAFWDKIAKQVDAFKFSIPAQLYMMQYTGAIAQDQPIDWSEDQKLDAVYEVETAFIDAKLDYGAIYTCVGTKLFAVADDKKMLLPRKTAAEICALVLTDIEDKISLQSKKSAVSRST